MSDERKAKPRGLSEVLVDAGSSVREIAEAFVASAKDLADAAVESEAWAAARGAAEAGKEKVRVAAGRASSSARELGVQARRVIELLQRAPEDAADLEGLVTRFAEALPVVSAQLDARADGILIGYIGESGVALQRVSGVEIAYVRGEAPRLRVSRLDGRGARLAAGASTSAYAGCLYGSPSLLSQPLVRRGVDAGVAVAQIAFFRAGAGEQTAVAGGWLVALNAGLNLGVPILSDFAAFEISEAPLGDHALTAEQAGRIENGLLGAPDRSWRRGIAQSLRTG